MQGVEVQLKAGRGTCKRCSAVPCVVQGLEGAGPAWTAETRCPLWPNVEADAQECEGAAADAREISSRGQGS